MAISYYPLKLIAPRLAGAEVLSLGFPELLLSGKQVEELFSYKPKKFMRRGSGQRHGMNVDLPDTIDVMGHVCKRFHCVDVQKFEGMEEICDLNHPQDLGRYDVVLDPGTLEHCWNVGQAWLNAANAVKVGGAIMHLSPVSMLNHGFWNFCPTAFFDFYTQNGWEIGRQEYFKQDREKFKVGSAKGAEFERVHIAPEHGMICIAVRKSNAALIYPTQSKYLHLAHSWKKAAA